MHCVGFPLVVNGILTKSPERMFTPEPAKEFIAPAFVARPSVQLVVWITSNEFGMLRINDDNVGLEGKLIVAVMTVPQRYAVVPSALLKLLVNPASVVIGACE